MDEVMPVARLLMAVGHKYEFVQFQLNNDIPDCFMWREAASVPEGLEVTIAQGRARYFMAKELVQTGQGRGFADLQDDDDVEAFRGAFSRDSDGYTRDEALDSVRRSI
jgi:hypothetical protein